MVKGVKIENLWKIFPPNVVALKNINVEIKPGEFYVILGPSGSGKTTLLRIIAGLEVPTKGRVVIGDKIVVDAEKGIFVEPRDRNIGMVFQNWALYPHMTAYDNIAFPLKLKKLPREEIDKKVKEVAEALGIADLLDRKPGHMSGGQQQRVAVARALVKQPDILLLDEPFSNLDARIRVTAREFVKEIQKKLGITTILVTHDQADAFAVGDRVMVLRNGETQQMGSPEELYNEPANVFIANFIGDPPMNIYKLPVNHRILEQLGLSKKYEGKYSELYIGIRPDEAVALKQGDEGHLVGKVAIIEYVGSRRYAKIDLGNGLSIRVLLETKIDHGDLATIRISRLHVFAPNGERLETIKF
ncbi:ABC transporter ATP-binding protein [Staphylothermus hellenicus]|uniref:ABC transporter related protein n=1 Tax=Staphylothermus hellenicus (strain DSM 12710 / JCM 10830 / BK20S6-10-b1 / P8) TaxID=591019 RepID=D7DCF1_STAHD|nr:ABC transporter ATP-binding protein [Staphylothermus hellenicus]ADI31848.1 ABC transporter related protein [Staphylothermus hellenicus DSM 12710]